MSDEKFSELEREFKSQSDRFGTKTRSAERGPIAVGVKKDEIKEIRSPAEFISWFISWEFKNVLTWPFIYGMIFPLLLLDLCASVYQAVCFRIYGIQRIKRSDYFYMQRHKLNYLNVVEKLNCDFCGYANGLIAFVREIFARTEQYWCPIKHAGKIKGAHERYENFLKYGEIEGYQIKVDLLRQELVKKAE